eukprot:3208-Heterococcus_DN1.PRE.2
MQQLGKVAEHLLEISEALSKFVAMLPPPQPEKPAAAATSASDSALTTAMSSAGINTLGAAAAAADAGCSVTMQSRVFESLHAYEARTDEVIVVAFPGALRISIAFDEQSRTEDRYDNLVFFKDAALTERWHTDIDCYSDISALGHGEKKRKKKALTYHAGCVHLGACMLCSHMYVHSGRHGNENFPGFGNRPPLVIEGDCAYVRWQTDGSNEDWGWRFTATAQFK